MVIIPRSSRSSCPTSSAARRWRAPTSPTACAPAVTTSRSSAGARTVTHRPTRRAPGSSTGCPSSPSTPLPAMPRSIRAPTVIPRSSRRSRASSSATRPDVVHFHSIQALGANLLAVAASHHIPVVLTMHDWWWWCARLFLVDQHDFVCPPRVASERCHCAPELDLVGRRRLSHVDAGARRPRAHAVALPRRRGDRERRPGRSRRRVRQRGHAHAPPAPRRPGPVRFGYFGGPDHRLKGLPTLLAPPIAPAAVVSSSSSISAARRSAPAWSRGPDRPRRPARDDPAHHRRPRPSSCRRSRRTRSVRRSPGSIVWSCRR